MCHVATNPSPPTQPQHDKNGRKNLSIYGGQCWDPIRGFVMNFKVIQFIKNKHWSLLSIIDRAAHESLSEYFTLITLLLLNRKQWKRNRKVNLRSHSTCSPFCRTHAGKCRRPSSCRSYPTLNVSISPSSTDLMFLPNGSFPYVCMYALTILIPETIIVSLMSWYVF